MLWAHSIEQTGSVAKQHRDKVNPQVVDESSNDELPDCGRVADDCLTRRWTASYTVLGTRGMVASRSRAPEETTVRRTSSTKKGLPSVSAASVSTKLGNGPIATHHRPPSDAGSIGSIVRPSRGVSVSP
jgi:hypothetical protein